VWRSVLRVATIRASPSIMLARPERAERRRSGLSKEANSYLEYP